MPRNLDLTSLRSFVTVAETGGVTRAAGFLNLTQSAVSMQLKRLEESLGVSLLDRSSRQIALTSSGEQMLSYARKMVELNDEIYGRLTDKKFEGEITLGVPHDIVYPVIPHVLQRFNAEFPRMKVQLIASYTTSLKEQFARGEADIILTTENQIDGKGEVLTSIPLRWVGAPEGGVQKQNPVPVALSRNCRFRPVAIAAMDREDLGWEMIIDTESDRSIEATVSADLAITVMLEGTEPPQLRLLPVGNGLPDLPSQNIGLYVAEGEDTPTTRLAELIRQGYDNMQMTPLRAVG